MTLTSLPHDWLMGALGGLMIGASAALYLVLNGRILGASGIVGRLVDATGWPCRKEGIAFLTGLILMPALIARFTANPPLDTGISSSVPLLIIAGVSVGVGTRLANGCTSGHGVCGLSKFSKRAIIATAAYLIAGIAMMALGRHVMGWF